MLDLELSFLNVVKRLETGKLSSSPIQNFEMLKSHKMLWIPHLMATFMATLGTHTLSFKFLQEIFLANVWFRTGTSYIVQMYNVCTSDDDFFLNQMFDFF